VSQSDQRAAIDRTTDSAPATPPVAAVAVAAAKVPTDAALASAEPPAPTPQRSPEEIERDIEATRARLVTSIDELADRVSPKNVAKRGVQKARLIVVDESGAPRTSRLAAIGAVVAAVAGIVLWRRRG
jgi:hypothetical protein